jgi:hypothetical protein
MRKEIENWLLQGKEEIQNYLKKTEEVIKWAESQLKKQSKN